MSIKPINNQNRVSVKPINTDANHTSVVSDRIIEIINGHSPIISERKTWLVYNDETQSYEDTDIIVTGEEIDPTVPIWAKAPTKPVYTPFEIGAVDSEDVLSLNEIESMF